MAYRVFVQLVLDVSSDAECFDAANEILREQQRHFVGTSCLIDYRVGNPEYDAEICLADYCEGDAFTLDI